VLASKETPREPMIAADKLHDQRRMILLIRPERTGMRSEHSVESKREFGTSKTFLIIIVTFHSHKLARNNKTQALVGNARVP
jgi:hypothetical protein